MRRHVQLSRSDISLRSISRIDLLGCALIVEGCFDPQLDVALESARDGAALLGPLHGRTEHGSASVSPRFALNALDATLTPPLTGSKVAVALTSSRSGECPPLQTLPTGPGKSTWRESLQPTLLGLVLPLDSSVLAAQETLKSVNGPRVLADTTQLPDIRPPVRIALAVLAAAILFACRVLPFLIRPFDLQFPVLARYTQMVYGGSLIEAGLNPPSTHFEQ